MLLGFIVYTILFKLCFLTIYCRSASMRTVSMRPTGTTPNTSTLNSRDFHHSAGGGNNTSTSSGSHILDTISRDRQSLFDNATLEKDRMEKVDVHNSSLPHKRDHQMTNHHHAQPRGDADGSNTGAHDDFNYSSYYQISYDTAQRFEAKANNQNASDDDNLSHDSYHLSEDLAGGSCSEDDLIGVICDDVDSHDSNEHLYICNSNNREALNLNTSRSNSRDSLNSSKSKGRGSLRSKSREFVRSNGMESVHKGRDSVYSHKSKSREYVHSMQSRDSLTMKSSDSRRDMMHNRNSASLDEVESCVPDTSVITYDNGNAWSRTMSISSDVGNAVMLQYRDTIGKSNPSITGGRGAALHIDNGNYISHVSDEDGEENDTDKDQFPPVLPDENENKAIDEGYEETLTEESNEASRENEQRQSHDNISINNINSEHCSKEDLSNVEIDIAPSPISDEGMRDSEPIILITDCIIPDIPPLLEEIKYTLHRRHVVSSGDLTNQKPKRFPRYMSPSPTRIESTPKPTKEQQRAQLTKIKKSLSSPIVYDNKTTFGPPKMPLDYVVLNKLPSVDSYSCKDDSLSPSLDKDIVAHIRVKNMDDYKDGITRLHQSRCRDVRYKARFLTPPKAEIEDLTTTDSAESEPLAEHDSSSSEQEEYKCLIPVEDDVNKILSECQDSDLSDFIPSPIGSPMKTVRLVTYQSHSISQDIPYADDGMDSDASKNDLQSLKSNQSDEQGGVGRQQHILLVKQISHPPVIESRVKASAEILSSSPAVGFHHLDASSESEVDDKDQISESSSGTDIVYDDQFENNFEHNIEDSLQAKDTERSDYIEDTIDLLESSLPLNDNKLDESVTLQNVSEIWEMSSEGSVEHDMLNDLLEHHTQTLAAQSSPTSVSAVNQPRSIEAEKLSLIEYEGRINSMSSDEEVEFFEVDELYEYQRILFTQQRPSLVPTVEQKYEIEIDEDTMSSCEGGETLAMATAITTAAILADKEENIAATFVEYEDDSETKVLASAITKAAITAAKEENEFFSVATAITDAAISAEKDYLSAPILIKDLSISSYGEVEQVDNEELIELQMTLKRQGETSGLTAVQQSHVIEIEDASSDNEHIIDLVEIPKYPEVLSSDDEVIPDDDLDLENMSRIMDAQQHIAFGNTKPHSSTEIDEDCEDEHVVASTSSISSYSTVPVIHDLIRFSPETVPIPQPGDDISSDGDAEHELMEHTNAVDILAREQIHGVNAVPQNSIDIVMSSEEEETALPLNQATSTDDSMSFSPHLPPSGLDISSESDREEPASEDLLDPLQVLVHDAQHHWGETILAAHPHVDSLGHDLAQKDFSGFSDDSDEGVLGLDMTTYTVHEISSDSDDDITVGTMPLPSDFLHSSILGSPCMLARVDEVDEGDGSSLDDLPPPPSSANEAPQGVLESPLSGDINHQTQLIRLDNIFETMDSLNYPCDLGTPLELDIRLEDPGTYVDLSRTMENLATIGSMDSTSQNHSDSSSESDFEDVGQLVVGRPDTNVPAEKHGNKDEIYFMSNPYVNEGGESSHTNSTSTVVEDTPSKQDAQQRSNTLTSSSSVDEGPLPSPPDTTPLDNVQSLVPDFIEPPSPITTEPPTEASLSSPTTEESTDDLAQVYKPVPNTTLLESVQTLPIDNVLPPIPPKAVPPKPPPKPKKDALGK